MILKLQLAYIGQIHGRTTVVQFKFGGRGLYMFIYVEFTTTSKIRLTSTLNLSTVI